MHPSDADRLGLADGDRAICRSARGTVEVTIERYDAVRPGIVTLPHGFGMQYEGEQNGPAVNGNVITNDNQGDPAATVTAADQTGTTITIGSAFATTAGGSLTLNANGTYTYTPPAWNRSPA